MSPPTADQELPRYIVHLFLRTHPNRKRGSEPSPQHINVLHQGTGVPYTTQGSSPGHAVQHTAANKTSASAATCVNSLLRPSVKARMQHYTKQLCGVWGTWPVLCVPPGSWMLQGLCATQPRQALGSRCGAPCGAGQGCPTQLSVSCSKAGSTVTMSAGLTPVLRVPHV